MIIYSSRIEEVLKSGSNPASKARPVKMGGYI